MYKIYKIIDNTNDDNVYIGITKQKYLCDRLAQHKYRKNCMSRDIIKNGDYRIELIEETEDKTRERYWIENSNCVNQIIPGRTQKEYYEDNKEKIKEYKKLEKVKEKKKEHDRKYREKNSEKLREYFKENYINNREKKLQQVKEYSEKNRDKILENKKEYNKIRNSWESSMGGRPCRENMSLLKIDPNLFF